MSDLVFLHLADIHFHKLDPPFDLDEELRNQLESDIGRMVERFDQISAILIVGDIAFSGKGEEYEAAKSWMNKIADQCKIKRSSFCVVPGNHDVDWKVVQESKLVRNAHAELRKVKVRKVDDCLREYLADSQGKTILFEPLKNFNLFVAEPLNCDSTANRLFWENDLTLNDGSILRLRGINSAIISDDNDHDERRDLVLSSFPVMFLEYPGVEYMSLCHHPPQKIREEDKFEDCLKSRVAIQLFGHKHRQRLDTINNRLRISAGAVHPARYERAWDPRYNWIAVHVKGTENNRTLEVRVWPRVWNASRIFDAETKNGRDYQDFSLPIKAWNQAAGETTVSGPGLTGGVSERSRTSTEIQNQKQAFMDKKRILVYRFLSLPFPQIVEIASTLGLYKEGEDRGVESLELFKRFISRAETMNAMERLWEAVEQKYGNKGQNENPFREIQ